VIFYDLIVEKDRLAEFLKFSPERRVPVIVAGDRITIGFKGA
jgi:glutathione S-transferase